MRYVPACSSALPLVFHRRMQCWCKRAGTAFQHNSTSTVVSCLALPGAGPGALRSIAAALEQGANGSEALLVRIATGEYRERLVITRPVVVEAHPPVWPLCAGYAVDGARVLLFCSG